MAVETKRTKSEEAVKQPNTYASGIMDLAQLFMSQQEAKSWSLRFETKKLNGNNVDSLSIYNEARKQLLAMDPSGNTTDLGSLLGKIDHFNSLLSDENSKVKSVLTEIGGLEAETLIWLRYLRIPMDDVVVLIGKDEQEILHLQYIGITKLSQILTEKGWGK